MQTTVGNRRREYTGSSEAPHLHIELRDFKGNPINPLPFYQHLLKDSKAPSLISVAVLPLDSLSLVNEKPEIQFFIPKKEGENYVLKTPIYLSGKTGIAYQAFDQMDETTNKFGIYKAILWLDDSLYFQYILPSVSFDAQKYVNLHTIYAEKKCL